MQRQGLKIDCYSVEGFYLSSRRSLRADKPPCPDFSLRNAYMKMLDRNHTYGQAISVRCYSWFEKDDVDDPKLVEAMQIFHPELFVYGTVLNVRGFVVVQMIAGNRVGTDPFLSAYAEPMRMAEFTFIPETCLTSTGSWLADKRPVKKAKA